MIIGNPYTFSIIIDIVDEWNIDKSFNNGLLFIGVNGVLIPDKILNATLNIEIPVLIKKLENPVNDMEIFSMEKNKAFICIYKKVFSDSPDETNCGYDISPWEFLDNDYFIFMVSDEAQVRILSARLEYIIEESCHNLEEMDVIDTYISNAELGKAVEQLKEFDKKNR